MTYINDQFFAAVKENIACVYLFCGKEKYIMLKAEQALTEALSITPDSPDYIKLEGKNCGAQDICEQCETLSFTGMRKLVRVSDYPAGEDAERLIAYMENPSEDCVLLLIMPEIDKRSRLFKAASRHVIAEFVPLEGNALTIWIVKTLNGFTKEITAQDAAFIAEYADTSLQSLYNELEKLAGYCADKRVTRKEILESVTPGRDYNIFKIADHILDRDSKKALELYGQLLSQRESPIYILGIISRQIRNMLMLKSLEGKGVSRNDIARLTEIKEFMVDRLAKKCSAISRERLKASLDILLETDEKIKTGKLQQETALELVISKLCLIR